MIIEYISGKIIDAATSYVLEQVISRMLSLVFQAEENNNKLLRSEFVTAKELLELAHLHLKNGETEQYYKELSEAAGHFRNAAPKLEPLEKIQTLCFAGICYRMLGEETKKKFYFRKASEELDVFITLRVKAINRNRKEKVYSLKSNPVNETSNDMGYVEKLAKLADSPGSAMMTSLCLTPFVFALLFIFTGGDLSLNNMSPILTSIRIFCSIAFAIYTSFFIKTEITKERIKSRVLSEEFPGFSGTSIGQMKAALQAGSN